jgi:hypothetical protein
VHTWQAHEHTPRGRSRDSKHTHTSKVCSRHAASGRRQTPRGRSWDPRARTRGTHARAHAHAHTPLSSLPPASAPGAGRGGGGCAATRGGGGCAATQGGKARAGTRKAVGRHGVPAAGRGAAAGRLRAGLLQPSEGSAMRRHRQPEGPHGRGHG